jgi:hypothetical protein
MHISDCLKSRTEFHTTNKKTFLYVNRWKGQRNPSLHEYDNLRPAQESDYFCDVYQLLRQSHRDFSVRRETKINRRHFIGTALSWSCVFRTCENFIMGRRLHTATSRKVSRACDCIIPRVDHVT